VSQGRHPQLGTRDCPTYSPVGPEALSRLGLDVYAPLRNLRPMLQRLLPEAAAGGYFAALRAAMSRGEVTAGSGSDQLQWLADHLRLSAPGDDEPFVYWRQSWVAAAKALGRAPQELGPRARRVLLDELLSRPGYQSRLADALTEAFRSELKQ